MQSPSSFVVTYFNSVCAICLVLSKHLLENVADAAEWNDYHKRALLPITLGIVWHSSKALGKWIHVGLQLIGNLGQYKSSWTLELVFRTSLRGESSLNENP